MKTNVAFCPHFHQPHFQLYNIREEVFRNCYLPWLELLEEMADIPGFNINLHFSGPLLVWLAQEKEAYLGRLQALFAKQGIHLVGGLADEAFTQLSARTDDILYQVRGYANLTTRFLGVNAREWEGLHIVERETGEWALYNMALAARAMGAKPLFYLDAETFFAGHFNYPGGPYDYCRQHFGFNDAHSRTTISHLPPELLHFALRDEIGGQEYFVLPVHTDFRYRLLKRQPFGAEDRSIVEPRHYLFYLQEAAQQAQEAARRLGKDIAPIIVIFEDAEKFGQWSKDPQGDGAWLKEFFNLVINDPNLKFCGLKSYLDENGFLDTYPVASSRSYPEWENWTAGRGIRGVTFGDEKLRKLMCRQRDLERLVQSIDGALLQNQDHPGISPGLLHDMVFDSPYRFKYMQEILSDRHPEDLARSYRVIQRIRNVAYQEDPRWASRHPSYGSGSYFDLQALAFMELAERLAQRFLARLNNSDVSYPEVSQFDWDKDGEDEILVKTAQQTVVIHVRRGQVIFQQAVADITWKYEELLDYLEQNMLLPQSYPDVSKYSQALIFTETDSELKEEFYPEGARMEYCRNGFAEVIRDGNGPIMAGNRNSANWVLEKLEVIDPKVVISLQRSIELEGEEPIRIRKVFTIEEAAVEVEWVVESLGHKEIYLVPELVTSAVPSDPIHFKPCSWLGIRGGEKTIPYEIVGRTKINNEAEIDQEGFEQVAATRDELEDEVGGETGLPEPQTIAYNY
ncbi:MAG: hypothetical protein GX825_01155, partial [Syntrophomonadaceae bacterium]|nr:hypothetical protein [Syntrophomonadaceae bacterium]